jgi:hypothetical protein
VLPAPAVLIDYLNIDNQYQGYTERPQPAKGNSGFVTDVTDAVMGIAEPAIHHVRKHLLAVFLVTDLGSTAYGELLNDFGENKLGFIVLDVNALNRSANDWITWRERSPFAGGGPQRLSAAIAPASADTRAAAIRFILLHEIGHVVGVAHAAHPSWNKGGNPLGYEFANISWKRGIKKNIVSRFDDRFPLRRHIGYYRFDNAALEGKQMADAYEQLLATDFVSLYAATSMHEDFAESYAMYVHVILQDQTWQVAIKDQDGTVLQEMRNPILAERCRAKKAYLDRLFE